MYQILLIINLIVVILMIGTILLQRSEGGALGIGGGGGGGLMSGRGVGNALTKATAILAALFMIISLILTWMTRQAVTPASILDSNPVTQSGDAPATTDQPAAPLVPLSE